MKLYAFLPSAAMVFAALTASAESAFTAESAFEQLVKLEGTWTGESVAVPVGKSREDGIATESTVTYESIANDTSVIATFLEGSPMEMVSVYHMDGPSKLIHTHYCAAGNQPSMIFEATDEPGVITTATRMMARSESSMRTPSNRSRTSGAGERQRRYATRR